MGGRVFLHKKHGVNPTMTYCYYCGDPKEILLVGVKTKPFKDAGIPVSPDGGMPRSIGVIDSVPCQKCEKWMKQGVILISIRDDQVHEIERANQEKRLPNPYRTGRWVVVKDSFISDIVREPSLVEGILKQRMCFIPDNVWGRIGLPVGEVKTDNPPVGGHENRPT